MKESLYDRVMREMGFRSKSHGNFHFSGNQIQLRKQGKLLLDLRDLEFLWYLLADQSRREGKDENYYWREFNSNMQKMIDEKVNEFDPQ